MENAFELFWTDKRYEDVHLQFCGYSKCEGAHFFGPYVRPDYIIHYVTSGKGTYTVYGKTYTIEAGQGFLIEPDVLTYYRADETDPWSYLWVGFNGRLASSIMRDMGLGKDKVVFYSPYAEELQSLVEQMLRCESNKMTDYYLIQSLLFRFFEVISRDQQIQIHPEMGRENLYVYKAVDYIQNNYYHPIGVQDIAEIVSINRSYLCTLFKNELGYSPQQYLTHFRITRAGELLSQTDLSIEVIATSCGYQDPLVFSKAFKRHMQMTPAQFRKHEKELHKEFIAKTRESDQ